MTTIPIFIKTCASERMAAAPTGSARAQIGQPVFKFRLPIERSTTAPTTPSVPMTSSQENNSPNHQTPIIALKRGVVELNVVDSVGPR